MSIPRRTVLGAGAALPLLAGSSSLPAAAAAGPSPGDWKELAGSITGGLNLPGSRRYESQRKLFDPHWDSRRPAAIARVRDADDVATCITFAKDHGLDIAARSGGHSYTGRSARNGALVVDTRSMRAVSLGSGGDRATIEAGAKLWTVHEELAKGDRSVPTGTCPTVGAAGLSLVGGLGVDSRRYGLMSDRLVSATVVDGRGRVLTVDEDTEPDLFWAIRGGGWGTGIVTEMTYRTIPARGMGFFNATFPASAAVDALAEWRQWLADQPGSIWSNAHLDVSGGSLSLRIFGVTPVGKEKARLASLRSAISARATKTSTTSRDFLGAVEYLGGGKTSPRTGFVAGSDVLRGVTRGRGAAIEKAMHWAATRGLSAAAILDPLDGAVSDAKTGDSAFPWRYHAASVQWYVGTGSTKQRRAALRWIRDVHELLGDRSSGGYLGYVEPGTSIERYLGANASRFRKIRSTYDPDGVIA